MDVREQIEAVRRDFERSLPARIQVMVDAWQRDPPDLPDLGQAAHKLAGAALTFGHVRIGALAQGLADRAAAPGAAAAAPDAPVRNRIEDDLRQILELAPPHR